MVSVWVTSALSWTAWIIDLWKKHKSIAVVTAAAATNYPACLITLQHLKMKKKKKQSRRFEEEWKWEGGAGCKEKQSIPVTGVWTRFLVSAVKCSIQILIILFLFALMLFQTSCFFLFFFIVHKILLEVSSFGVFHSMTVCSNYGSQNGQKKNTLKVVHRTLVLSRWRL